jgi:O-acetyl-ADP-ribose deacetylase (regulator of RNase III)
MEIEIVKGDITELDVECIVNPANSKLVLGGGVAGAIRKKGGDIIQEECDKIGYCETGNAVITSGGNLKAKYVIHAVGPLYGIDFHPARLLENAVINSLSLANSKGIKTIALPAISTGIFGYPMDEAALVIVRAVLKFSRQRNLSIKKCYICLYKDNDYKIFQDAYNKLIKEFNDTV